MENLTFRKANLNDAEAIWDILQQAISKRKNEGSNQWQDGYPNPSVVENDLKNNFGYVVENQKNEIISYIALIDEIEPAYTAIEGKWLTDQKYLVIHRMAVDQVKKVKGLAEWMMKQAERIAKENQIFSIKVDTNFDNGAMLYLFEKLGYTYCGEVYFRGSARKAFEKVLV